MRTLSILVSAFILCFATGILSAPADWMTRAVIDIHEPGLVETLLPMELHQASSEKGFSESLDLALVGPDEKKRALELFWVTEGEIQRLPLAPMRVELLEDRRLLWEASTTTDLEFGSMEIFLRQSSYAGKIEIECQRNGEWINLAKALPVESTAEVVDFNFSAQKFDGIRLYFAGYDKQFGDTPIFVKDVVLVGQRPGSSVHTAEAEVKFDKSVIDGGIELRILLPGSGLHISEFEIFTGAQFQGSWQLGRETVELGRREFSVVNKGVSGSILPERKGFVVSQPGFWRSRTVLLRLFSDSYYGGIEKIKVRARLPRVIFNADTAGKYSLQTGSGRGVRVSARPGSDMNAPISFVECAASIVNNLWQSENLLENYSIKGGPFNSDGYSWSAPLKIAAPGFYQLITEAEVSLDKNFTSIRIVRDEVQIPYLLGRSELRELPVSVEHSVEKEINRSSYLIKLPDDSADLVSLSFKSRGIFDRTLQFERHFAGRIGWQPWQNRRWVNKADGEAVFVMTLHDFPKDQREIRIRINHGSNQAIDLADFKGLYYARDIFFVATEAGEYRLFGGNPEVKSPVYDLEIVQDRLLEMIPQKVSHGDLDRPGVAPASAIVAEHGAAFNDSGYTWVATFPVDAVGLYQVTLNLQASLDDNRNAHRLVKNDLQIPYFRGQTFEKAFNPEFSSSYDRKSNTTTCLVRLPVASKYWRHIVFHSSGIFSRKAEAEIRKPGKLGWQTFSRHEWVSKQSGNTVLKVPLERLPAGENELRLVIVHGDNQPVEISSVEAFYTTENLVFVANEVGEYRLFGGNSKARAPAYDLALIKNSLLKTQPRDIQLGDSESFKGRTDIHKHLQETFSETGWGLYFILGLVTAILLILIVKLFPEEQSETTREKNDQDKE